ncbi:hypothetical protein PCANC_27121 [Puccinia coronata f. sp. avenae]|uniref:pectin lyase n=1 Tax=Puccinia coronata f. sp. avenae TaxID=200324 RepID=A0A2N5T9W3_9BASI|nr:hypothetical protein PCANC_27121 [Puccinia coronata f. sp. avenae]
MNFSIVPFWLLVFLYIHSLVLASPAAKISSKNPSKHHYNLGSKKHASGTQYSSGGQSNGGSPTPNKAQITGGGNAPPQTPQNADQLKAWLADNVPRVILISTTFDFTKPSKNVSDAGCIPWAPCQNGNQVQQARDFNNWCSKYSSSHKTSKVSFREAPLEPLAVGSQKTLLGVGKSGVLIGKGLVMRHSTNVIIRNIAITNLNPQMVWGGDSIMMDGASDVLIEHCTFSLVGRQMIVTGGMKSSSESNINIRIMNNLFDGRTQWSARCQNRHYWNVLISGPGDTVTMANNCFDSTSGRSPKTGGAGNPNVYVHYYNNLHTNIIGESFEVGSGSTFLAEGNVFKNAKFQDPGDKVTERGGNSYVPFLDADAQACQGALGRPCVKNLMLQSSPYQFGLKKAVLQTFQQKPPSDLGQIKPAANIVNGVPGGCGAGHI